VGRAWRRREFVDCGLIQALPRSRRSSSAWLAKNNRSLGRSAVRFAADVREAGDGSLHSFGEECAAPGPGVVELEMAHDQRQVDLEQLAVSRRRQRPGANNRFREFEVARQVERAAVGGQVEAEAFACTPGAQQVVWVGGQEQVLVFGDERRTGGVVVGAPYSGNHVANVFLGQGNHDIGERPHGSGWAAAKWRRTYS
jgi:hypothetical protein